MTALVDPFERVLWSLAQNHVREHHGPDDCPPDDPSVLALRDLLVHAWEGGAKRTMGQAQAVDDALVRAAGMAPPVVLQVSPIVPLTAAQQERAAVVAYVRDRARWLRAEEKAGGDPSLCREAKSLDYVAEQIAQGRRAGSHIR